MNTQSYDYLENGCIQCISLAQVESAPTVEEATEDYISELNAMHGADYEYSIDPTGRKFKRIVATPKNQNGIVLSTQRSCYGFVETATGLLWKAAGWKAPAKNYARGNVFNDRVYSAYGIS